MLDEKDMNVRLPNEIIRILDKSVNGKNIDEKVRLSLAIGMFVDRTVTLERAAELAGKPLANFIDILRSKKVPWMEYTEGHLEEDEQAIQNYLERSEE
jgi:predicted HTH domain antitoxin